MPNYHRIPEGNLCSGDQLTEFVPGNRKRQQNTMQLAFGMQKRTSQLFQSGIGILHTQVIVSVMHDVTKDI